MKGLSKELVLELSKRKKEPKWVLEKRLLGRVKDAGLVARFNWVDVVRN